MLAAVGLAVLGACSENEKTPVLPTVATQVATTTIAAPPSTAPAATSVADDRRAARRIVLTPADVPTLRAGPTSGYADAYVECGRSPLLPAGDDPRQARPTGYLADETATVGRVQTTVVNSWAVLAPSEAEAREIVAILRRPETTDCVTRRMASAYAEPGGAPVTDASTAPLRVPAVGDEGVAFRAYAWPPSWPHV